MTAEYRTKRYDIKENIKYPAHSVTYYILFAKHTNFLVRMLLEGEYPSDYADMIMELSEFEEGKFAVVLGEGRNEEPLIKLAKEYQKTIEILKELENEVFVRI